MVSSTWEKIRWHIEAFARVPHHFILVLSAFEVKPNVRDKMAEHNVILLLLLLWRCRADLIKKSGFSK